MEEIRISNFNGVHLIADEIEVFGKKARLKITIQHKNPGEQLDKTTSRKLAEEISEWLIERENSNATII